MWFCTSKLRRACGFQNLVWTRPHVHMPTGTPETSLLVAFEEIQFSKVGTPYCTWFLVSTKHRLARCRLCSKLSRLDRPDNASGLKPNPLEPVARWGRCRFTYTSPWESWGWFRWPEREIWVHATLLERVIGLSEEEKITCSIHVFWLICQIECLTQ